ncbi:hypothetical protein WICPIJ_001620 [Wickerhamomyces pijperi]|uniref:Uncharacterized protein n=1 Tax=Wickerhamomyces pijperi TaxID=599730 RepID=A0A9P8QAH8_WICPI|nr:hypothetical protein WICPIJ_001620 [Wickerhamomyces pijperi]
MTLPPDINNNNSSNTDEPSRRFGSIQFVNSEDPFESECTPFRKSSTLSNELESRFDPLGSQSQPSTGTNPFQTNEKVTNTAFTSLHQTYKSKTVISSSHLNAEDFEFNEKENENEDEEEMELDSLMIPIHSLPPKLSTNRVPLRSVSAFDNSFTDISEDNDVISTSKNQTKEELQKELNNLKILLSTSRRLERLNLTVPTATSSSSSSAMPNQETLKKLSEQEAAIEKLKLENEELKRANEQLQGSFDNLTERYDTQLQESLELKDDLIETQALNAKLQDDLLEFEAEKEDLLARHTVAVSQAKQEKEQTDASISILLKKFSPELAEEDQEAEFLNLNSAAKLTKATSLLDQLQIRLKKADEATETETSTAATISQLSTTNQDIKTQWQQLKQDYANIKELIVKKSEHCNKLEDNCSGLEAVCHGLKEEITTLRHEIKERDNATKEKPIDYDSKLAALKFSMDSTHFKLTQKLEDCKSKISMLEEENSKLKKEASQLQSHENEELRTVNSKLMEDLSALTAQNKSLKSEEAAQRERNSRTITILQSNIEALTKDKDTLSSTVARLRKTEAKLTQRYTQAMKSYEESEQQSLDLIDLILNFTNKLSFIFAEVLEDSSVANLRRKLSKLNDIKNNKKDIHLKSLMVKPIFDFFSETSKSVILGYFEDIEKLERQEKLIMDLKNDYETKIDQLTEELRWHVQNQNHHHHQPSLHSMNKGSHSESLDTKLRIESLERKWKAEREKRKMEGDSANIMVKKLHDKIDSLNKDLLRYTHPERFNR